MLGTVALGWALWDQHAELTNRAAEGERNDAYGEAIQRGVLLEQETRELMGADKVERQAEFEGYVENWRIEAADVVRKYDPHREGFYWSNAGITTVSEMAGWRQQLVAEIHRRIFRLDQIQQSGQSSRAAIS